jgi:hypothetical protein
VALKTVFGKNAYEPAKLKSPAQIEKLSSRGKEMVLEWGFKPDAQKLSLAPIDDPRPAAKGSANEKVFKNFGQSPEELGW